MARRQRSRRAAGENERSVAEHVRDRQRAVAEREAARLAKPEQRPKATLGHADRTKSAVSSTPFGTLARRSNEENESNQVWCGPFSVARQMIAEREEAKRLREAEDEEGALAQHPLDAAMAAMEAQKLKAAHPSLQWKSRMTENGATLYAKRQKRAKVMTEGKRVPTLFSLCVDFLVENFEHVEALGDVDNTVRSAIIKELVAAGKMNGDSFKAIAEPGIEALELCDCAEVTGDQLATALRELLPRGLQYLVLDQSGRCFGPKAVDAIVETSSTLFALSVGGAYLLKDADAAKMVRTAAKTLSSIEFKACPLLGLETCRAISESFVDEGRLMELALEDLSLDGASLEALAEKKTTFQYIKSLSLRRIENLSDALVTKLLEYSCETLENLDLSHSYQLTDATLSAIRQCANLRSLSLSHLKHLTTQGLEALFLHVPGLAPPPMLQTIDLGNCDHEAVTDGVVDLMSQAATRRREEDGADLGRRELLGGLVRVDWQGCRVISDATLEHLVATSASTLQEINVSFCPAVTDKGMGYLVDKCGCQLSKIQIWGCAQITDEFLDGHHRVNDPELSVVGAWMKKSTTRTIR